MTDLEKHVNRPGRDKQVKKVREKINELGITYIYYQFISVTGRVVGKGIPADHWERTAEKGFQLVYGATANLFLDRHNNYIGYGPEAMELVGIPDPETFCQLPWDKRVGRVFVTCFRNREERNNPGGHLTSDCRGNLRIFMEPSQKSVCPRQWDCCACFYVLWKTCLKSGCITHFIFMSVRSSCYSERTFCINMECIRF